MRESRSLLEVYREYRERKRLGRQTNDSEAAIVERECIASAFLHTDRRNAGLSRPVRV
jgi:hypothetical protein